MNVEMQKTLLSVQNHLKDHHPGGAILEVIEHKIYNDQGCWYIPIRPSIEPSRTLEYFEALAEVENDVLDDDGITVLLIPVYADEQSENKSVA